MTSTTVFSSKITSKPKTNSASALSLNNNNSNMGTTANTNTSTIANFSNVSSTADGQLLFQTESPNQNCQRQTIQLSEQESQICNLLVKVSEWLYINGNTPPPVVDAANTTDRSTATSDRDSTGNHINTSKARVTLRIAGGWVRDKVIS
jgi:hypothetical protein